MPETFASLPLSRPLQQVTRDLGYAKCTDIQAQSIPLLLEGRDLIGQSKTGSGKTAAFALPLLNRLKLENRRKTLQGLVLCPTRELCAQVAREIRKLARHLPGAQVTVLAGGLPLGAQLSALEHGTHVAVGTPGRVLDHLSRGSLDLSRVSYVVLDEADRMLDMGFQEDMRTILGQTPAARQTVFFSATFPTEIVALSRAYQRDPARVTVQDPDATRGNIEQFYVETPEDLKTQTLIRVLERHRPESAIVFCNLKATTAEVARALQSLRVSAEGLHGDLEQRDRDRVLAKFRNRTTRVLVATDVAARGLDVEGLDLVINYDLPRQIEVYVHRIGRTGRAGKTGTAVSLIAPAARFKIPALEAETGTRLNPLALSPSASSPLTAESAMETLSISGGRKEKLRAGDILGALTGEAGGLEGSDIGKIEIHDHFAYVAVRKSLAPIALQRLRDGRIKGRKFRVHWV